MDYSQIMLSKRPDYKHVDLERMSIVTATLLDVVSKCNVVEEYINGIINVNKQRWTNGTR